eukprot:gene12389-16617_t
MNKSTDINRAAADNDGDKTCNQTSGIIISTILRGNITHRIFKTWEEQINVKRKFCCSSTVDVKIVPIYDENCTYMVASEECLSSHFIAWSKQEYFDFKDKLILFPSWIVDSLEHAQLKDVANYIHFVNDSKNCIREKHDDNTLIDYVFQANNSHPNEHLNDSKLDQINEAPKPQFACMSSGKLSDDNPSNPNEYITSKLEELEQYYDLLGDEFRCQAYKKCCAKLKQMSRITQSNQLDGIRMIGKSIVSKIEEIIQSGDLKKLHNFRKDSRINSMKALGKIWGVGSKTATLFIKRGFRSVDDLRIRGSHLLNFQQLIGLKHYEDFQVKIPRAEMEQIYAVVAEHVRMLSNEAQCMICGSYRRRKSQSGDIDILIIPPAWKENLRSTFLSELILSLESFGLLTDHLALPHNHNKNIDLIKKYALHERENIFVGDEIKEENMLNEINDDGLDEDENDFDISTGSSRGEINTDDNDKIVRIYSQINPKRGSYMGVCNLKNINSLFRRIDIKTYPRSSSATAMLYFTGSDHFNRSMRLYARKNGFVLNDKALMRCVRDSKNNKMSLSTPIRCDSERDIFAVLGLEFKEPWERNCFDENNILSLPVPADEGMDSTNSQDRLYLK